MKRRQVLALRVGVGPSGRGWPGPYAKGKDGEPSQKDRKVARPDPKGEEGEACKCC